MKEKIWKHLSELSITDFFITAIIFSEGDKYPVLLDDFIFQKLEAIRQKGISARKFLFKEGDWKIYLTFFPTQTVVDERYALKNMFTKKR